MPKFIKSTVYLNRGSLTPGAYAVAVILGRPSQGEWRVQSGEFPENAGSKKLNKVEAKKIDLFLKALESRFSEDSTDLHDKDLLEFISGRKSKTSSESGLLSGEDISPFLISTTETIIIPDFESGFAKIFGENKETKERLNRDPGKLAEDYETNAIEQENYNEGDFVEDSLSNPNGNNVKQLFGGKDEKDFPKATYPDIYPPELTSKQKLVKEFVNTGFQIAELLDKTLEVIAEPFLDRLYEENEKRALEDPVYAEIEYRRRSNGTHILYAEEFDLKWEEWDTQREILDKVSLKPWWEKPLRFISRSQITGLLSKGRWLYQRATRSWDDKELWSLDKAFTKRLGEQLIALSLESHGWPGEENGYPTSEEWVDALNKHGNALREYALDKDNLAFYTTPEGAEKYRELADGAKEALAWVSNNLELLWD